jgi:hypothetical protein
MVTGIDISMLFDSFALPRSRLSPGRRAGTGIGGIGGGGGSEAQFDFAAHRCRQTSRQPSSRLALPIEIGFVGAVDFDNGYATTQQ